MNRRQFLIGAGAACAVPFATRVVPIPLPEGVYTAEIIEVYGPSPDIDAVRVVWKMTGGVVKECWVSGLELEERGIKNIVYGTIPCRV
jgi:hypothetical protein